MQPVEGSMAKRNKLEDCRRRMWSRLAAEPETLDLNDRNDEEPEDLFVRLAKRGSRNEVVRALAGLVAEHHADDVKTDKPARLRFLRRAIRLCDTLGASRFRHILKCIVMLDSSEAWGPDLAELQELAARALSGLRPSKSDLNFWIEVAQKHDSALPYALNAAIRIDLKVGVKLLCETYLSISQQRRAAHADWRTILQIAAVQHEEARLAEALYDACCRLRGFNTPLETFLDFARLADMPSLLDHIGLPSTEAGLYRYPLRIHKITAPVAKRGRGALSDFAATKKEPVRHAVVVSPPLDLYEPYSPEEVQVARKWSNYLRTGSP